MPGRVPKPDGQRRERNLIPIAMRLPAEGYRGGVPRWPLTAPSAREQQLWGEIWHTPQAAAWDQLKWYNEVALYVRWAVRAEDGDLRAGQEMRLLSDRIGMSPMAMQKLHWQIAADEVAEVRQVEPPAASARRRLAAVDPAAVAE